MAHAKGPSQAEERRWQAEDDLRTLTRAMEIKNDKARYRRAMAMAKEQLAALQKVQNA